MVHVLTDISPWQCSSTLASVTHNVSARCLKASLVRVNMGLGSILAPRSEGLIGNKLTYCQ